MQLIEAEYATPLRIEDAAEACGCSQSHFMRWFKKMTGQGFTAYLNDHRLNLAAELLRITDATVLDIAGRVGFDNLSYFNRLFIIFSTGPFLLFAVFLTPCKLHFQML